MAQDVKIAGATYMGVPSIEVPNVGGGNAVFVDTSDADATADDILQGKKAYVNGQRIIGTGSDGSDKYLPLTGGTLTGNLYGKYFSGTWLQTTEASNFGKAPPYIAVLDGDGWIYKRTPAEILEDIGAPAITVEGHTLKIGG